MNYPKTAEKYETLQIFYPRLKGTSFNYNESLFPYLSVLTCDWLNINEAGFTQLLTELYIAAY